MHQITFNMKSKHKLYTANKWNQPAFMPKNRFNWGGTAASWDKAAVSAGTTFTDDYMNSTGGLFGLSKADNPFSKGNLMGVFSKEGIGSAMKGAAGGLVSGLAGAVGGLAGNAIAGGLSSGAGNAIGSIGSTVGSAVGAVNPVLGAAIGVGSQLVGGLTNRMFGTKVDEAALKEANEGTNALNNFTSKATSMDAISGPVAQANVKDVYSGGWFSSGDAAKKNEELKRRRLEAKLFAQRSVDNNIFNIADDQINNSLANYSAFGGPIDIDPSTPIGYSIYTDRAIKDK